MTSETTGGVVSCIDCIVVRVWSVHARLAPVTGTTLSSYGRGIEFGTVVTSVTVHALALL